MPIRHIHPQLPLLCTILALLFFNIGAHAETPIPPRQAPESRNQIVKFTDRGIEPAVLMTNKTDSIVFFLNATTDSLTTIEIDYKSKRMHCASSALTLGDDGKIRSVRPFGPRSFTSACFPDRGSYTVTVYGINGKADRLSGTIIVE